MNVSLMKDWRFLPHFPFFLFLEIPRKADDKFVVGFPFWKILQGDTCAYTKTTNKKSYILLTSIIVTLEDEK